MGQDISVSHQVALLDTAFIPEFTLIMTNLLPQFLITLGYFVASLHVPLAQPILKLPRRCSQPRLIYNLTSENAPTINGVTNASFVNNHLVQLKIWTEGPRTSEFALPGFRSEPNEINLDIDQGTLSWAKRSFPTYATLADLKGVTFYVLPLETRLSSFTGSAIAISPDKNRIVIADTFRRVFLYDCRGITE